MTHSHPQTHSKDCLECTALLVHLSECHWTRDVCIHTHPIKPSWVAVIWPSIWTSWSITCIGVGLWWRSLTWRQHSKDSGSLVSATAIPVTDRTRHTAFIRLIVLSVDRMSAWRLGVIQSDRDAHTHFHAWTHTQASECSAGSEPRWMLFVPGAF